MQTKIYFVRHAEPDYANHNDRLRDLTAKGAEDAKKVAEYFMDKYIDMEVSIGDYVLTGGELPGLVLADCVARLTPGVLSDEECFTDESHYAGLLEYPQYTRPAEWEGRAVPEILLSGHHENIRKWRREQAIRRTFLHRPDMLESAQLSEKERAMVETWRQEPSENDTI